ncbi:TrkH family potassium uptake protein [Gynuella sunshinyii]|uniref:Trk system potassium uptake protein n=1 Tax=Gynuella sunshinyii YC6258 TaxID=1445510 RepID=A0A0C5VQA2_9GAMM|nr:TrkH family potassium uptake protein [Gynuella sunshinyii]AJQ92464.1 trk-type K+ transport system, membrane component [Gynuella sunshinyii YC6258]
MNLPALFKLSLFPVMAFGLVDLVFSFLSMLVFRDDVYRYFYETGVAFFAVSVFLAILLKFEITRIRLQEAILFVTLAWISAGFLASVPFILISGLTLTDAVFESLSALTTTGATVMSGLDAMPKTLLLYRQTLQWFGGLGIIILMVAIMPMLNIGGMKMYKAETPGPMKDDKLVPRVSKSSRYLWGVYLTITVLCTVSYYLAGMNWFDAVSHAFSTVSTGGFSPHDASMKYFDSVAVEMVSNVFMIAGALNFGVHFIAYKSRDIKTYWRDEETVLFLGIIALATLLAAIYLTLNQSQYTFWMALRSSLFQVISFITSTGFASDNFTDWPIFCAVILVIVGYVGGCAGSTAGGNKVIRTLLVLKTNHRNIKQLIHPKALFTIKSNGRVIGEDILDSVRAFMFFSFLVSLIFILLLMANGLDLWTSITAVAACVNVLGPAFGELGSNFQPLNDFSTWLMSLAMVMGRLEYFTVLLLFSVRFWRA